MRKPWKSLIFSKRGWNYSMRTDYILAETWRMLVRCYCWPKIIAELVFINNSARHVCGYSSPKQQMKGWKCKSGPRGVILWSEMPEMWRELIGLHEKFILDRLLNVIEVFGCEPVSFCPVCPENDRLCFFSQHRLIPWGAQIFFWPFGLKLKLNLRTSADIQSKNSRHSK